MTKRISTLPTVSDIKPADYNPRIMTDYSRDGLKKSIEEFGDLSGITWNRVTGNLVTGHQRWEELNKKYLDLFLDPINNNRCEIKSLKEGETGFFIRIVDWELKKERAANMVANNIYIQGAFDSEKLPDIMNLIEADFGLDSLKELNLDPYLISSEWISDLDKINTVLESVDSFTEKIILECIRGEKEEIKKFLSQKLLESNFTDVSVR